MTPKSFAIVACRLLAVWFFVQAAQSLYGVISNFLPLGRPGWARIGSYSVLRSVLYLGMFPLILVCASVVLWLGTSVLAGYMTRDVESEVSNRSENGVVSWQAVGFSLIAMFAVMQGFSNLVGSLGFAMFVSSSSVSGVTKTLFNELTARTWLQIAVALVQFVVGLILLLWSQKTIRVLDYLQRGGRDESSND